MQNSPDVDAFAVQVSVHRQVVTLSGMVASYAERVGASELAGGVPNVETVRNAITVREYGANWFVSDESARQAVRDALDTMTASNDSLAIDFTLTDHVVTLHGVTRTQTERALVRHTIASVLGVDFVSNLITVSE